ncbi:MAG: glycosyltransferase family 9 protein, partial [Elusimicrobiota bacterium]
AKNKFLVIRFSSLGDVVLATSFIEFLKKTYPEAEIYMLTKDAFKDVFVNNPHISQIFTIGKKSLLGVVSEIKKYGIDYIVDLHSNLRSRIVSSLIPSEIMRYDKNIWARRILVWTKKWIGDNKTIIKRYTNCVSSGAEPEKTKLFLLKEELKRVEILVNYSAKNKYIGISPSARWETKRWLPKRYAKVIEKLLAKEHKVILFGDESDIEFNNQVIGHLADSFKYRIIDTTGILSLRHLFAAISLCDALLTTDSAPMHIAQSLGVNVVALFGPTVKEFGFWNPNHNDILIEKKLACRPCSLHGTNKCPKKHFNCMMNISVSEVFSAIIKSLGE